MPNFLPVILGIGLWVLGTPAAALVYAIVNIYHYSARKLILILPSRGG